MAKKKTEVHCCSFCGRSEDSVPLLLTGKPGCFICSDCVKQAAAIVSLQEDPSVGDGNAVSKYSVSFKDVPNQRKSRLFWMSMLLGRTMPRRL